MTFIDLLHDHAGRYRTIYADPPWAYGDSRCGGGTGHQYSTVTLSDLCDPTQFPVAKLSSSEGAHLWLWTTWPMIRDGAPHQLVTEWGFRWVGEIVWLKGERLGVGRWLRPSTEILVFAERGKQKLTRYNQRGHVYHAPRGGHSAKPDGIYELIESLSPGPYVELFARRREPDMFRPATRDGWTVWGDEA